MLDVIFFWCVVGIVVGVGVSNGRELVVWLVMVCLYVNVFMLINVIFLGE